MSFSDGFAAGASVGDRIQQRLLAKELRKLEDARYNDERDYRRSRDAVADTRYGEERTYQRDRDALADTRYGEERQYRIGRDTVADTRDARDYGARRGDAMMAQIERAIQNARQTQRDRAEIGRIQAQTDYYRNGGGLGASRAAMGYDEYGPDGELLKRRVPVGMGAGAPASTEPDTDAEAQVYRNDIAQKRAELAGYKKQLAAGNTHWGPDWLPIGKNYATAADSTQGDIDRLETLLRDRQAQMGRPAIPTTPQTPQAAPAQLSPQDQQALQWAQANPNDPRAAAILQRLGSR